MDEIRETVVHTMDDILTNLCKRLKAISVDVERLQRVKEQLTTMQNRQTLVNLLGVDDNDSLAQSVDLQKMQSKLSFPIHKDPILPIADTGIEDTEDDIGEELSEDLCLLPFDDEDRWHNFFNGFEIINTPDAVLLNGNSNCIELTRCQCDQELKCYLLSGVRCFMIDLFTGTIRDNQTMMLQIREAELSTSKEYGFPVVSTVFAKLSPRYQYTGYLSQSYSETCSVELKRGYKVMLTVDRQYSNCCTSHVIYVNARFLLCDVKEFDFILLGEDIQLMVKSVGQDHINCCVARPGLLTSYMPVRFPSRCRRFRVSYEELEDLTFSREVGINVVVSNFVGTIEYLDDLEEAMAMLECDHLRLYARVVLNEILGCDGDLNWVMTRYDGLFVELARPKPTEPTPNIMHLCPDAECLMQLAHDAKKPIVLDATLINQQILRIDPAHYYHMFYFPDKYLIKCDDSLKTYYFSLLQGAIFDQIGQVALAKMPFCDSSHTGADTLARSVVTASYEVQAVAIVVCGVTTRMVQKISHFRPRAPILFISHMRSAEDYVSLYHNVTMLSYRTRHFISHRRNTYRKAIYALAYLAARKKLKHNDQIILVYNYEAGTSFPENYLIYKFDKHHFTDHMASSMFPVQADKEDKDTKPHVQHIGT
ncbi:pyruvate kinase [Scaptodrosophila lebanonensis]|uniref:Pyruvate kinase n=1 Tax=Drosophila lebanonensis TaxID=7225 RepID=A0A6J2U9K9_DROLE|nr:pyruvate kinase [Scaptodrosophila lebanonensis]